MKVSLLIFLTALTVRVINLMFLDLNPDIYLVEDQRFYWEWSLKYAYLPWSEISANILSERMPGAFLYFEILQWLTDKNLFLVLLIQSIIDSFTCVIISNCAYMINHKYKIYTGLFAAFSPLLIILSSQILSDTLFLFMFVCSLYFLLKFKQSDGEVNLIYLSGIMLGLATFTRAATFPFIFLSLPIIYLLIKSNCNKDILKTLPILFFFLVSAIIPISPRLYDNIITHNTYALTSQNGSHAAYWMVPGVLAISSNLDRDTSIKLINSKIEEKGGLTNNAYKDSGIMMNISMEILSNQNIFVISYSWLRSSVLNIITPALLIDKRVRDLSHPSFAESGNIRDWANKLFFISNHNSYKNIIIFSLIISLFTSISFLFGFFYFYKKEKIIASLSILIIIYFSLLTGPTLSPKYCLPFIPILFFLQSLFFEKFLLIFNKKD